MTTHLAEPLPGGSVGCGVAFINRCLMRGEGIGGAAANSNPPTFPAGARRVGAYQAGLRESVKPFGRVLIIGRQAGQRRN